MKISLTALTFFLPLFAPNNIWGRFSSFPSPSVVLSISRDHWHICEVFLPSQAHPKAEMVLYHMPPAKQSVTSQWIKPLSVFWGWKYLWVFPVETSFVPSLEVVWEMLALVGTSQESLNTLVLGSLWYSRPLASGAAGASKAGWALTEGSAKEIFVAFSAVAAAHLAWAPDYYWILCRSQDSNFEALSEGCASVAFWV